MKKLDIRMRLIAKLVGNRPILGNASIVNGQVTFQGPPLFFRCGLSMTTLERFDGGCVSMRPHLEGPEADDFPPLFMVGIHGPTAFSPFGPRSEP